MLPSFVRSGGASDKPRRPPFYVLLALATRSEETQAGGGGGRDCHNAIDSARYNDHRAKEGEREREQV